MDNHRVLATNITIKVNQLSLHIKNQNTAA